MLNPLNDNSHYRFQGGHCLIKSFAKENSDMGILVCWSSGGLWYWDFGLDTALPPTLLLLIVCHDLHIFRQTAEYLLPAAKGLCSIKISVPGLIDMLSFAQQ